MDKIPEMIIVHQQLTDQDYKNIFARAFLKFWWIFIIFLGFLLTGGYLLIEDISQKTVRDFLNDNKIMTKLNEELDSLRKKASNDISLTKNHFFNQIKKYETLPYQIGENCLTYFDSKGNTIRIQYGIGLSNKKTFFSEEFDSIPIVHITMSDIRSIDYYPSPPVLDRLIERHMYNNLYKITYKRTLNVVETTKKYFIVNYGFPKENEENKKEIRFNWFAIGN